MSYDAVPNLAAPPVAAPTRKAGLDRLEAFAPKTGRAYASNRNYDHGPGRHDDVSRLSPYLRTRLILETEVIAAALDRHSATAAEKFIQEVYWRTYFKGWLEQRPSVWRTYCAETDRLNRTIGGGLKKDVQRAIAGETGIDCFDAWARELTETGYLHNHARMWFASIWIFTLKLPWQLGADFFYRRLLDGDPASNTLSWRWVAGLHTKGKTYLARADNIEKYTDGRFTDISGLAAKAPALEEPHDHARRPLSDADAMPDGGRIGLLVTEEDCAPENLFSGMKPAAALGLGLRGDVAGVAREDHVNAFRDSAVRDALSRAREAFNVDGEFFAEETWTDKIATWAQENQLDAVVTAYAPVGPVADRLDDAADMLSAIGVDFRRVRRPFDDNAWPHATKGFFGLKKKIPDLLDGMPHAQPSLFQ